MKRLARLFRSANPDGQAPTDPPPRPERLTYAVGDIHGRDDLLQELLAKIAEDAGDGVHDIVFVGDYVDRGPDSAAVLRRLYGLENGNPRVICLMGNHDYMMLQFLAAPADGASWLLVGGQDTLTSFGIAGMRLAGDDDLSVAERVASQADALAGALGPELTEWLSQRPLWWRSGDLIAVHAHTDPDRAMSDQTDETLLWARPPSEEAARADGAWVVHGHTIVREPTVSARHVNVDTGAFRGGSPLTAGVFRPGEAPRFLYAFGAT